MIVIAFGDFSLDEAGKLDSIIAGVERPL